MLRQYIFVPVKLRMSGGKIASQCCHAAFLALELEHRRLIDLWKRSGMCVIVLECKDSLHLLQVSRYCDQEHIIHSCYCDEGYTEVSPCTVTALATGILTEEEGNQYFGQFRLYNDKKLKR